MSELFEKIWSDDLSLQKVNTPSNSFKNYCYRYKAVSENDLKKMVINEIERIRYKKLIANS